MKDSQGSCQALLTLAEDPCVLALSRHFQQELQGEERMLPNDFKSDSSVESLVFIVPLQSGDARLQDRLWQHNNFHLKY